MLEALSAGPRTDLQILSLLGSTIEDRGDHLVVRSPHNPQFHWGNYVHVTTGDPGDADRWVGTFRQEFPEATWTAIGLPALPSPGPYAAHGLTVDTDDVLSTRHLPERRPRPEGYVARQLVGDDDWEQVRAVARADNDRTGRFDPSDHDAFTVGQIAGRRRLVDAGHAAFFGAFTPDGALVADLGIVVLGTTARYQSVKTDAAHRRRGLAGHLLGVAASWAAGRGAEEWVIVTDSSNPAGRLYRSVGFTEDAQGVGAYREPDR